MNRRSNSLTKIYRLKEIICNKLLLFFQFSIDFLVHIIQLLMKTSNKYLMDELKIDSKDSISTNH